MPDWVKRAITIVTAVILVGIVIFGIFNWEELVRGQSASPENLQTIEEVSAQ